MARVIPQQEGKHPMKEVQIKALRTELNDLEWLDALMMLMKAAGNDTRARILYLLWRRGEVRVNDLATILQLTPPAVS
ncbi:MAG: ArsR family transcriptional regulator, partial [Rhodothermales bacterium]